MNEATMLNLICLSILTAIPAMPPITVRTETYEGWTGCFRVSNGLVDLVVVPQIGRIMRFGAVGQRNLLWEGERKNGEPPDNSGWKNWGGDKVWPAPQDSWGWPPETEYDGATWNVTAVQNGVHMQSTSKSAKLGLRFERTILLKQGSKEASIQNTLINDSGIAVRHGVWEICQVDNPESCLLPTWKSSKQPTGWHAFSADNRGEFVSELDGELTIKRDAKTGWKYGSGSPKGYVSANFPGFSITLKTKVDARAEYADQGSALQVFTSPDPWKYVELELTGPLTSLKPGQSTSITVTMTLNTVQIRNINQ